MDSEILVGTEIDVDDEHEQQQMSCLSRMSLPRFESSAPNHEQSQVSQLVLEPVDLTQDGNQNND